MGGCGLSGRGGSYRFSMTVEVSTPRGVRRGRSVMEITAYETLKLTSEEHSGGGGLKGNAVVVNLPDGPIFALLTTGDSGQPLAAEVTQALAGAMSLSPVSAYVAAVRKLGGWFAHAKADLPRAAWPTMVRFDDINNPKTAQRVDPAAIGVKRIVVETTSDAVTTGIEKKLGWLISAKNFHFTTVPYGDLYPYPSDVFWRE